MNSPPDTVRPSSDLVDEVQNLSSKVEDLSAQVGICVALCEVTAVRVAIISNEKEVREEEYRKLRRLVRERLGVPSNGHPQANPADAYFRRELESLSDEIDNTKTRMLEEQVKTLQAAQAQGAWQKWHAIPAIILAIATLAGVFYGGRGSAPPPPPPVPYAVPPTAGVHP